jgi:hypothetical protein
MSCLSMSFMSISCYRTRQRKTFPNIVASSFNTLAADEIFITSSFAQLLSDMQANDISQSDQSSKGSSQYRPKSTSAGESNGLVLLLDSHSDQVSAASYDIPNSGFATVFVASAGNFPLMNNEGIEILPGYTNTISVTRAQCYKTFFP